MALGAKLARPQAQVVCIVGDGGFGHVWAELETAVREDLPVTVILLNNSILGFQKHAELFSFDEYTSAIAFHPVDHAAIARAKGFLLVSATPLTRSSYHADADFAALRAARGEKLAQPAA